MFTTQLYFFANFLTIGEKPHYIFILLFHCPFQHMCAHVYVFMCAEYKGSESDTC